MTDGLQRAFHAAGAKSTLSSLWPISDGATHIMMGAFYRNLWIEKMTSTAALTEAQRWMKSEEGREALIQENSLIVDSNNRVHPTLWSGWILSTLSPPESVAFEEVD